MLEACEGIAMLSTLDPQLGLVRVRTAPGCEEEVALIMQEKDLKLFPRSIDSSDENPSPS